MEIRTHERQKKNKDKLLHEKLLTNGKEKTKGERIIKDNEKMTLA
jgi:hypothetical protein